MAHYERLKGIREGIEAENTEARLSRSRMSLGGACMARWRSSPMRSIFIEVLVERAPGTSANPTVAIARKALKLLEEARSGQLD